MASNSKVYTNYLHNKGLTKTHKMLSYSQIFSDVFDKVARGYECAVQIQGKVQRKNAAGIRRGLVRDQAHAQDTLNHNICINYICEIKGGRPQSSNRSTINTQVGFP